MSILQDIWQDDSKNFQSHLNEENDLRFIIFFSIIVDGCTFIELFLLCINFSIDLLCGTKEIPKTLHRRYQTEFIIFELKILWFGVMIITTSTTL